MQKQTDKETNHDLSKSSGPNKADNGNASGEDNSGRGLGRGGGKGRRDGTGGGRGRGGGMGAGPGGSCICPKCGEKVAHQLGTACFDLKCLKCGATMTRA